MAGMRIKLVLASGHDLCAKAVESSSPCGQCVGQESGLHSTFRRMVATSLGGSTPNHKIDEFGVTKLSVKSRVQLKFAMSALTAKSENNSAMSGCVETSLGVFARLTFSGEVSSPSQQCIFVRWFSTNPTKISTLSLGIKRMPNFTNPVWPYSDATRRAMFKDRSAHTRRCMRCISTAQAARCCARHIFE